MDFDKSLTERLIPLIVERERTDEVFVCHEGFNLEAGGYHIHSGYGSAFLEPRCLSGNGKRAN